MEGKDLVALRNEASLVLASRQIIATEPVRRGWLRTTLVFAAGAVLGVALIPLVKVIADLNATANLQAPPEQSVSVEAKAPPPPVEIGPTFDIMAASARSEPADKVEPVPDEAPQLPKFLAWAADKDTSQPMENAQPLADTKVKATPQDAHAEDTRARDKHAKDRRAKKREESRTARRHKDRHHLASARRQLTAPPAQAASPPPEPPRQPDFAQGG
jgi:hypothetical protein